MSHSNYLKSLFTLVVFLLASCSGLQEKQVIDMPNPASVFCEENGGKLEISADESGAQFGVCIFDDGSECDEWAFFRGECKPGDSLKSEAPLANLPNPASVFCEENSGKLEIRSDETGAQSGACVFDDGSECDEWAFFRGECKPGDSLKSEAPLANLPNPASVYCEQNQGKVEIITAPDGSQYGRCIFQDGSSCEEWAFNRGECKSGEDFGGIVLAEDGCRLYQNAQLGYSVHFPADAIVTSADDPQSTLTIRGPKIDDEYWPMIFINHPLDRADFKPPLDVVLEDWLIENNLLVEERLADGEIAGELSIHTRHARSGQSYASDSFWFAHEGQLYNIVILHAGDKEDWKLYEHILQSFSFDQVPLYP